MSHLKVDKINGRSIEAERIKAYLNYDQQTQTNHISLNVSSSTDISNGRVLVSLVNAMSGTRNVISGAATYGFNYQYYNYTVSGFFKSPTELELLSYETSSPNITLLGNNNIAIHGDLA